MGVIDLGDGALAYLPERAPGAPAPVMVVLHGAGGDAVGMIAAFRAEADRRGIALVAPRSAGSTWDLIQAAVAYREGRSGARLRLGGGDAARVEAALDRLGAQAALDARRVTLAGFSDGASYALTIGPTRPDRYRAIIAFSPGFQARPASASGRQPVFVSHGRADRLLAFDGARDRVVPAMRAARHAVTFRPFAGGHTIPAEIIAEAFGRAAAPAA